MEVPPRSGRDRRPPVTGRRLPGTGPRAADAGRREQRSAQSPGPGHGLWRVLPGRPANSARPRSAERNVLPVAVGAALAPAVAPDGEVPSRNARTASTAPPGCRGPACAARDLQKKAAAGAPWNMADRRPGAGIEIRFSVRCEAAWARIRQSWIGDRVEIAGPGGRTQRATVADKFDAEGHRFTPTAPAHGPSVCAEAFSGWRRAPRGRRV
ncbi:DUF2690 domain-containing protein [Streptomyces sp. NPDC012935]|uniref:DUF2690 domain-containing protein n=1 Tax=Streptomyces sp. NPDC012935 TaxID=3364857 RepID=UPI0036CF60BF